MDDAELITRCRQRDAEAFGVLVERHQRLVFGVALARCQDPALAEDVAQEAFVTAWRDLDRLRDSERVGSWVAGIARNLAASAVRTRARRRLPEPDAAPVPTPEDAALEREDRDVVRRALASVPEGQREVLVLYYLEGESIAAIAAALGLSDDTVKQRLSRGRKALRESVIARVEHALERTRDERGRRGPAFRAGVLAALTTAGGVREAAASTAATTATTTGALMGKKIIVAGLALAVVGTSVWLGTRARAADEEPVAAATPSATGAAPATAATTRPAPASAPRVTRLADPAQRTTLLEAIRARAAQRTGGGGSAPTVAGPPPALPTGEPAVDQEYIRSAVRELVPMLAECYEQGLERDPAIAGTILVEFTIEGEADVGGVIGESAIDEAETTLPDRGVRECIQETMYALQIDPPAGGGVVRVRYPFEFRPAAPEAP